MEVNSPLEKFSSLRMAKRFAICIMVARARDPEASTYGTTFHSFRFGLRNEVVCELPKHRSQTASRREAVAHGPVRVL
jgi:hypothetical protein